MKQKNKIISYILILIACIIFTLTLYIKSEIHNTSFEQLIYSLTRTKGTSFNAISDGLFFVTIRVIIIMPVLILPTINFGKKIEFKIKNKNYQIYPIKHLKLYSSLIFIISFIYLLYGCDTFTYLSHITKKTDIFDKYYVSPKDVDITFPENKKNLIYIFMESTETSNLSKESGGVFTTSIMPNLERLAKENINFSHNNNLGGALPSYGTGWTVAAMIGQTSGLPLKVKIVDLIGGSIGYKKTQTIGDILYANGYTNKIMMGSDANFGGRREYFENHHYIVSDYYNAIEEKRIDPTYHEWWGYEDSKLLEYAKEELLKLSSSANPFNLTLLTADTHFTDGYIDKSCTNNFDNHYAGSFNCSDKMINDFITWVYNQDFGKNTVIIISGDHTTMQEDFYENIDKSYIRTTYNVFINSSITPINNKNRIFTSLDMYPSTLASLGVDIEGNRLGLGTNLFSEDETLAEKFGIDKFNEELSKYSKYYYQSLR